MFFRRQNWNVVGWLKIVSAISYAVILAGLLMMCYNFATHGIPYASGSRSRAAPTSRRSSTRPVTQDAIKPR